MKSFPSKLLITAVLSFIITLLIYDQGAGINLFITGLIVTTAAFLFRQDNPGRIHWFPLLLVLVSAIAVALHGNLFSILIFCTCLLCFAGNIYQRKFNIPLGLTGGGVTLLLSGAAFLRAWPRKKNDTSGRSFNERFFATLLLIVVPVFFFMLYRGSNVVFSNLLANLDLDLKPLFILLFLLITYLFFAFSFPKQHPFIRQWQRKMNDNAVQSGKASWITGASTVLYLFILLNLLIASVNVTDIVFLWGGAKLPEGVTFSDMVHQGVGTLIVSILFTILTILLGFRGDTLFKPECRRSVLLAYGWIWQTVLMVLSTVYRNILYVEQYDLTHKRLGVFLYLLLAVAGLITTIILLKGKKTPWYLFRVNTAFTLAVLVAVSPVNWDRVIMRYNLEQAIARNSEPDYYFLLSLSHQALPLMKTYMNKTAGTPHKKHYRRQLEKMELAYALKLYREDFRSMTVYDYLFLKERSGIN